MAKVQCKCGNLLSDVQTGVKFYVYTKDKWYNIIDMGVIDTLNIPFPQYDVWKCPECGRISVYDDEHIEPIAVYCPEQ